MNTITVEPGEITRFAAAVRAALADLPVEEIDELTDGLEADLLEAAAEDGTAGMADPARYADELRQAAGYPTGAPRRTADAAIVARLRAAPAEIRAEWDALVERLRARPVIDFFAALRPVWWVFRAWAVYMLFGGVLGRYQAIPTTVVGVLLLVGLVVLSVQLGRGRWFHRWAPVPLALINVALAIATPFVLGWGVNQLAGTHSAMEPPATEQQPWHTGLTLNGQPVSNIYAYDAQGNLLENVQLYDQLGQALDIIGDPTLRTYTIDGATYLVPNADVPGRPGWNVYPLSAIGIDELGPDGHPTNDATPTVPKAPFDSVRPLAGSEVAAAE